MRSWLVVLCACAACGRLRFDAHSTDGGGDLIAHDGGLGFGTPQKVLELESPQNEIAPSLRADELEIIFASLRPPNTGSHILWDATRTAKDQPFGTITQLSFAGAAGTSEPALSDDGLQLYTLRNGGNMYSTNRATLTSPWASLTDSPELVNLKDLDYIGDLRLVGSDMNGNLVESTRPDRLSSFATPVVIPELVVPGTLTEYPTASADGLELFFQMNVSGTPPQLARAVRPAIDQPFGPIETVDVGFPTIGVGDAELSHDGHTLYFVVKDGPNADYDLYQMTR